jgi:hypothetical protein
MFLSAQATAEGRSYIYQNFNDNTKQIGFAQNVSCIAVVKRKMLEEL